MTQEKPVSAPRLFLISGRWKDNPLETFSNFLVTDFHDVPEGFTEDDIFYFGLSEPDIQDAIEKHSDTVHEFIIISYEAY